MTFTVWKIEEKKMLRIVITRPGPGPEFSFRTRYPVRPEICLLVPPLSTITCTSASSKILILTLEFFTYATCGRVLKNEALGAPS